MGLSQARHFQVYFFCFFFFNFEDEIPPEILQFETYGQTKYDTQSKAASFCVFVTDLPVLNRKNLIRLSFEFLKAATGEMESLPIRNW